MTKKQKYPFHKTTLKNEWSYTTGAVMISLLALGLVIVTGGAWGVTGPLASWGTWFVSLFGVDVASVSFLPSIENFSFWQSQPSMTNLGIVVGALVAALLAAQFKFKKIKSWKNVVAAISGGLLMGIGARVAFGCNIGALFSGLPAFSLHGWGFLISIFFGAAIGSVLLKKFFM